MKRYAFIVVLMCIGLLACTKAPEIPPLPQGKQTLTGSLLPTELSLSRRGTHLLKIRGTNEAYVESSAVNLSSYEGKTVGLTGTYERNTDPADLPVFVVESVSGVVEEKSKEWELLSLGIRLEAPESWNGAVAEDTTVFTVPGTSGPVLTLTKRALQEDEEHTYTGGTPIVIDGTRALRSIDESNGTQEVRIPRTQHELVLTFTPDPQDEEDILRETWLKLLTTIKLTNEAGEEDILTQPTGTGSAALGQPCGGPAGILCPAGAYCDVTHLQENIGICKRL